MKEILLLLTFFISQTNFAQVSLSNDYVDNPALVNPNSLLNRPPVFNPEDYENIVLNVNFHVVNEDDGSRATPIGEEEVMNVIRDLNVKFGPYKIYFKYQGFNQINESDYLTLQLPTMGITQYGIAPYELQQYSKENNYHNNNSINIFIVDNIYQNQTNIDCGYTLGDITVPGTLQNLPTVTPLGTMNLSNIFIMASYLNTSVMLHEMGHVFGLRHTNRGGCGNATICEHVTRDESSSDYNADVAGDYVTDTPASPAFYLDEEVEDCVYVKDQTDCTLGGGVLYRSELVPIKNYMNVNREEDIYCQDEFTVGQGVFMRANIGAAPSDLPTFLNVVSNTVASLYEPFEVMDVPGDAIVSVTPVETGGAIVCRNILRQHRFQKGFNCRFQGTLAPDSTTTAPDDLPIVKNNTLQFKIRVNELDPTFYQPIDVICTRGVICGHETYRSGRVLSTPQLGSYNFNIEPLNEIQVNDPNLVETLENNQFHVITKETESGATNQTTIYKN